MRRLVEPVAELEPENFTLPGAETFISRVSDQFQGNMNPCAKSSFHSSSNFTYVSPSWSMEYV